MRRFNLTHTIILSLDATDQHFSSGETAAEAILRLRLRMTRDLKGYEGDESYDADAGWTKCEANLLAICSQTTPAAFHADGPP